MVRFLNLFLLLTAANVLFADDPAKRPYCAETVYETSLDATTPLGFSGNDLLRLTATKKNLDWSWDYRQGATSLSLSVVSPGRNARYIDSVAVYPDGAEEIGIICADRVEVDAWINFATNDGAFNERWFTTLYDTDGTDCMPETGDTCVAPGLEARFDHQFSRDNLIGNFYKDISVPEDLTLDFFAHGRFSDDKTSAQVYGQAWACNSEEHCYSYYLNGGATP